MNDYTTLHIGIIYNISNKNVVQCGN